MIYDRLFFFFLWPPKNSGAELVGERGPYAPPLYLSDLLVENLGEIDTRPGFHSSKSIFPPGYKALRMMIDGRQQRALKVRCSIYVEGGAPAFRIGECDAIGGGELSSNFHSKFLE